MPKCPYSDELKAPYKGRDFTIGVECLGCCNFVCEFFRSLDWQWEPKEVAMLREKGKE